MADTNLLTKIKNGLGITGDFQDATLTVYVDEVKAFMRSAGVTEAVIESDVSAGCIMRGVADLWNYGSGNAKLSDYFKMRLIQLKATTKNKVYETVLADYTENINIESQTNTVTFTYPDDLPVDYSIQVFVNGILDEENEQYSISGNTITFSGMLIAGTNVTVKIFYVKDRERESN